MAKSRKRQVHLGETAPTRCCSGRLLILDFTHRSVWKRNHLTWANADKNGHISSPYTGPGEAVTSTSPFLTGVRRTGSPAVTSLVGVGISARGGGSQVGRRRKRQAVKCKKTNFFHMFQLLGERCQAVSRHHALKWARVLPSRPVTTHL